MVDTPSESPNYYQVSYIGDTTPPVPMYEERPIEPTSFPPLIRIQTTKVLRDCWISENVVIVFSLKLKCNCLGECDSS